MERKREEVGYLIDAEAEGGEDELVESLQRRRSRHTKNSDASTDSAELVLAGISTASSNLSTITSEEQEPEPEAEPVQVQGEQRGPEKDFQFNADLLVSNVGPRVGDAVVLAAAGAGNGVVSEGSHGNGVGEVEEEELLQSESFEKEQGTESAHKHQEAENGDVGFIASKTDLIYEEYDLTTNKPNGTEDQIENFHEIRDRDVGISVSWRASVDDLSDLKAERYQEALSPLNNENENFSDVRLLSPRQSYQEETGISLIEEVEPDETEYDVQKVLEKQNTHELFCPKCHSCITRKVILRRRRRKITRFCPGARGGGVIAASERDATESITEAEDQNSDVPAIAPVTDIPADVAENHRNEIEPEVFRCLSCFTFFIPAGDGFKLFRIFEKRGVATNMPESQEVPAALATDNSFFSFLPWKKKPAVLEGSGVHDTTLENKTEQRFDLVAANGPLPNPSGAVSSAEGTASSKPLPSANGVISEPMKVEESGIDSSYQDTANGVISVDGSSPDQSVPVSSAESTVSSSKPLPSANGIILEPMKVEESGLDSSSLDKGSNLKELLSIITDKFDTYWEGSAKNADPFSQDMASSLEEPLLVTTDRGWPFAGNGLNLEGAVVKHKAEQVIAPSTAVTVVVGETVISIDQKPMKEAEENMPLKDDLSTVIEVSSPSDSQSSNPESELVADSLNFSKTPDDVKNDAAKEPEEPVKHSTGDSVVVTIERAPASQTTPSSSTMAGVENPLQAETQPLLHESRTAEVPEARDFDILKSIVYGGLVESIASLGVVSSAAGGGAATLNTLALALANLIGGLFVLVHNLRELKNEQSPGAVAQTDVEEGRYYQQLGRRGKFSLHATVAVISYLVFGLVAPITYGFSFRMSDDRDYKLAAVAAASLPCILFLALGKAHVRSKSYIKVALYYLLMGFAASGISFLVGELVDKLLEQLGLFETGSSSASVSGVLKKMMSPSGAGWASY